MELSPLAMTLQALGLCRNVMPLSFHPVELDDVRTLLAKTRNNGQYVPLKLFRARKHNSINVTDIVTGLWCEVQLEYKHLHPHMKKTREWSKMEEKGTPVMLKTPVMKQGAEIHLKKGELFKCSMPNSSSIFLSTSHPL